MNDKTINFIEKAIKIHGDKYDYSKVDYIDNKTKIKIVCKEHGEFIQNPYNHLKGHGCNSCGMIIKSNKRNLLKINNKKSNTEEFIIKAIKIHDDKYDYSKVDYINSHIKVKIICKIHGEFLQNPYHHLNRQGCKECSILSIAKKNSSCKEKFINKAIEIHGYKYDYSNIEYINNRTKVKILCKIHGEFLQIPNVHLNGRGCNDCKKITLSSIKKYSKEEFIEKAIEMHDNKYSYLKVDYIDSLTKVKIICKYHGDFLQLPSSHIRGDGCPNCANKTEGKLYKTLLLKYPNTVCQFKQDWCKNIFCLPFDFCIPEHKIIIELDGLQHFKQVSNWKSPEEQQKLDKYKELKANENNYSVIRILQQDVYNDTYNWYQEICNTIEEIIKNNKVANYYLCKNNEYKNYL